MTISEPLSHPTSPGFKTTGWTPRSAVGVVESPFTYEQQVHESQGRRWEITVTLPPMLRATARKWQSFFLKCDGRKRVFLLGDPAAKALSGTGGGTPLVSGAHAVRATTLNVKGLPEAAGVWVEGDFIQIGSGTSQRVHMVLNDVSGLGSPTGESAVDIWPPLREALADGDAITTSNCKGCFRLADSAPHWNIDEMRLYGVSFSAVEAI